jgi:hypothetical protein
MWRSDWPLTRQDTFRGLMLSLKDHREHMIMKFISVTVVLAKYMIHEDSYY